MSTAITDILYGSNTRALVLKKAWLPSTGLYPTDLTEGLVYIAEDGGVIGLETYVIGDSITYYNGSWIRFGSSGGTGFDPTANQSITGEWTFDVSGGKSFFVSDDPTMADATGFFGVIDHLVGFNADNVIAGYYHTNATINNVVNYSALNDDGSVALYSNIENNNGLASDWLLLTDTGVSSRTITVDTLTIDSEVKIDLSGGKTFLVSDDITMVSPNRYIYGDDHVSSPTAVVAKYFIHNPTGTSGAVYYQMGEDNGDASSTQVVNCGVTSASMTIGIQTGLRLSYMDVDTLQFDARYANLAAISAVITAPAINMFVMVTGQGLATYNGTNWVKASDDTTLIT